MKLRIRNKTINLHIFSFEATKVFQTTSCFDCNRTRHTCDKYKKLNQVNGVLRCLNYAFKTMK